MRSPVDERGSSRSIGSRSDQVATTFSMPTTLTSTSGRVRHIRPLPSDSTTTSVPVSATAKLAPLTATLARRNFSRRCARAAAARTTGSSVRSAGAGRPTAPISARKISRISARLRWIAGTRMCEGRSSPSCTMSSARSVSQAAMPSASSASLRPISWVTIDLTLTTSSTPWAWAMDATIALASAASLAQCTVAPLAVSDASSSSSWVPRSRSADSLTPAPARRSSSQSEFSLTSSTRRCRFARMVPVAYARLCRSWALPSASCAATGNFGIPTNVAPLMTCSFRRRQDLGEMDAAHAGLLAGQQPADVGQARVVAGGQYLGAGVAHVPGLVGAHGHGRVGVLEREGAAEAAALVGGGELQQRQATNVLEQLPRLLADAEHPQRVAGRVVGDRVRVVRAHVGHAEHVDEELRELVDLRRRLGDGRLQRGVAGAARD